MATNRIFTSISFFLTMAAMLSTCSNAEENLTTLNKPITQQSKSDVSIKSPCTEADTKYSQESWDVDAKDAYSFGLKIQQAVREKDLQSLFSMVEGELDNGPRKAFIKDKEFDQVFSEDWRKSILEDESPCIPIGWRGFRLGNGIWYGTNPDDNLKIFSINNAVEEIPETVSNTEWGYKGLTLQGSCFTTPWLSNDNYEHFHETFAENIDIDTFSKYIGRYMGKQVPVGPVPIPWIDNGTFALAVNISYCSQIDDNEKTYQVLKKTLNKYCVSLAPNFPQSCQDVRLVETTGPCGGSMGCTKHTAIYGIIEDQKTKESHVVPLVNFDSANDGLNFVDELEK